MLAVGCGIDPSLGHLVKPGSGCVGTACIEGVSCLINTGQEMGGEDFRGVNGGHGCGKITPLGILSRGFGIGGNDVASDNVQALPAEVNEGVG